MVDECKREDTGVGPSIAIGNHQLKIKSEDLPKIDKTKIKIILSLKLLLNSLNTKIIKDRSPKRLYKTAQMEEAFASHREPHHEISKNDIKPILSQPVKLIIKLLLKINLSIKV